MHIAIVALCAVHPFSAPTPLRPWNRWTTSGPWREDLHRNARREKRGRCCEQVADLKERPAHILVSRGHVLQAPHIPVHGPESGWLRPHDAIDREVS